MIHADAVGLPRFPPALNSGFGASGRPLGALSTDDLRAWQRAKLADKSRRTKQGAEPAALSARTVGMAQGVLRRALNDAMRDDSVGLARNVAALVRLPAGQTRGAVPPTEAEIGAVLKVAAEDSRKAVWFTTMGLGLRRGEVLALRWSRLDLDAGTVRIAKQIGRVRGERDPQTKKRRGTLVESDTKTDDSTATLALPAAVTAMLREHRAEQVRQRLAARLWADEDLVFTTSVGTAIEPRNLKPGVARGLREGRRPAAAHPRPPARRGVVRLRRRLGGTS